MVSVREYAILYVRGTRTGGTTIIGGGNAVLETGQHALNGPEHTNLDAYAKATLGGEEGLVLLGTMGATQTLDLTLGNYFYGTLGADCTFIFSGARNGYGNGFIVELDGDFNPTWPGSVTTNDTDPGTGTRYWVFVSRTTSSFIGFLAGGSGTAVGTLDDLSDVVITSPANGHRFRYDGSNWVNTTLTWEPMIASDGSVMTDGNLNPMQHEVAY